MTIIIDRSPSHAEAEAQAWLAHFNDALQSPDWRTQLPPLFSTEPQSWWKDQLSLTWDLRTLNTLPKILDMVAHARKSHHPRNFQLTTSGAKFIEVGAASFIEGPITFQTDIASCSGVLRLVNSEGSWKLWIMFTRMEDLRGFEEDRRRFESRSCETVPDVLIVGAGQCGCECGRTYQHQCALITWLLQCSWQRHSARWA